MQAKKGGDSIARNDGVDRIVARNNNLTAKQIGNAERHNERKKVSYVNTDIVPERSYLNYHYKSPNGEYSEIFSKMEQNGIISTSMTYKNGEKFALNHHAGFITLRKDTIEKIDLEFFSIFLQNFYREMGVSDGSKTLSLTQIYAEEFELPDYSVQKRILASLETIKRKLKSLEMLKEKYYSLLSKETSADYSNYQKKNIDISTCIGYMSGNTGLTEECIYQNLQNPSEHYQVLSSATEEYTMMGEIPLCVINDRPLKVFEGKEGLLVTRNGKAGYTKYLDKGKYTINDHAYILFVKDDCPYQIDLKWLATQYKQSFLDYSSSSDNGTWNMTGFFTYTQIDIPSYEEQLSLVSKYNFLYQRIEAIERIEEQYRNLLSKEIA